VSEDIDVDEGVLVELELLPRVGIASRTDSTTRLIAARARLVAGRAVALAAPTAAPTAAAVATRRGVLLFRAFEREAVLLRRALCAPLREPVEALLPPLRAAVLRFAEAEAFPPLRPARLRLTEVVALVERDADREALEALAVREDFFEAFDDLEPLDDFDEREDFEDREAEERDADFFAVALRAPPFLAPPFFAPFDALFFAAISFLLFRKVSEVGSRTF
jgi:hypothetical protein